MPSDRYIVPVQCKACKGSGMNSRGNQCYPCAGTGRQGACKELVKTVRVVKRKCKLPSTSLFTDEE